MHGSSAPGFLLNFGVWLLRSRKAAPLCPNMRRGVYFERLRADAPRSWCWPRRGMQRRRGQLIPGGPALAGKHGGLRWKGTRSSHLRRIARAGTSTRLKIPSWRGRRSPDTSNASAARASPKYQSARASMPTWQSWRRPAIPLHRSRCFSAIALRKRSARHRWALLAETATSRPISAAARGPGPRLPALHSKPPPVPSRSRTSRARFGDRLSGFCSGVAIMSARWSGPSHEGASPALPTEPRSDLFSW